jgi:hypothetical protein
MWSIRLLVPSWWWDRKRCQIKSKWLVSKLIWKDFEEEVKLPRRKVLKQGNLANLVCCLKGNSILWLVCKFLYDSKWICPKLACKCDCCEFVYMEYSVKFEVWFSVIWVKLDNGMKLVRVWCIKWISNGLWKSLVGCVCICECRNTG